MGIYFEELKLETKSCPIEMGRIAHLSTVFLGLVSPFTNGAETHG